MKVLKRTLAFLLATVMVLGCLSGCESEKKIELTSLPVTVEGSIFGGSKDQSVKAELEYGQDLLPLSDNEKYNSTIAGLSAILCADSYFRDKDLAKGSQNRVLYDGQNAEEYDHTSLLQKLGFTEVEYIESFKAKEYALDGNDSATFLMAHANVEDKYDSFVFVIRGCFSAQEWLSIYDPGADTDAYTSLTGDHPEWTDKDQFKGANIAAGRAMEFIKDFMEQNSDPSRKPVVLVTGHSRGGAIANIIGAKLEENAELKTYTYTFNTPNYSATAVPGENKTIFNILEDQDLFADPFPFGQEEFHRYGTDVVLEDDAKLAESFLSMSDREMPEALSMEDIDQYKELFGARFADRASLYETKTITESFEDEAAAQARYEECANIIGTDLGIGNFVSLSEVKKTDKGYELTISYCDGAWLACFAKTLAYGSAAYQATINLFSQDEGGCQVEDFLGTHGLNVNAGHLLLRTYLISQLAEEK